jgi:hypothetical protein
MIAHAALTIVFLLSFQIIAFILNLPLLAYNINKLSVILSRVIGIGWGWREWSRSGSDCRPSRDGGRGSEGRARLREP